MSGNRLVSANPGPSFMHVTCRPSRLPAGHARAIHGCPQALACLCLCTLPTLAAHCRLTSLLLYLLAVVKQLQGRQVGTGQHSCIQKRRLLRDVHRRRLIQQRDTCHLQWPTYTQSQQQSMHMQ